MIDHRGLFFLFLSLFHRRVSGKGLKLAKGQEPPLFVLHEKIIALLRGTSQGSSVIGSWDSSVRRHANTWLLELHSWIGVARLVIFVEARLGRTRVRTFSRAECGPSNYFRVKSCHDICCSNRDSDTAIYSNSNVFTILNNNRWKSYISKFSTSIRVLKFKETYNHIFLIIIIHRILRRIVNSEYKNAIDHSC